MKPVIFDVDTGVDDAVAIMLGANLPIDIKFFCSSTGNTKALQGANNTMRVLEALHKKFDVVVGSKSAFQKTRPTRKAHGQNGLGGVRLPLLGKPATNFLQKYATTLENSKKPVTILVLGPITNLAIVLKHKPHLAKKIKQVIFMGSSLDQVVGNAPYASFNVACDPEALEFVLAQNIKLLFVPNNLGRDCFLTTKEVEKVAKTSTFGTLLAKMFEGYHDHFVKNGVAMYDPTAVYTFVNNRRCKIQEVFMEIRHFEALGTALAIPHFDKPPNARIVLEINPKTFKKWLFKTLKKTK